MVKGLFCPTGQMVKQSVAGAQCSVNDHTERSDGVIEPSTCKDGDQLLETTKLGDNITYLNSEENISKGEVIVAGQWIKFSFLSCFDFKM